jgi:hypothetical protein
MKDRREEDLSAGSDDCEFVPPLDLPETWGIAWDRQLTAALAWQAALQAPMGEAGWGRRSLRAAGSDWRGGGARLRSGSLGGSPAAS